MKAIIMAGGEGSRLRPLTCNRPKPMVPVLNRPVMSYCIDLLKKHGITEIGVTLQYLPEAIKEHFGDGSEYGVRLHYFVENTPLGTAGSVKNAGEFLDRTFLVISGDALTDLDLSKAIEIHRSQGAAGTLVLTRVECPLEYGVVITGGGGRIIRFLEKPGWGEVFSDTVNTGIYVLEPDVLNYFTAGQEFDFSKDLFPLLMRENRPLFGVVLSGYWCDIGNLQQYLQAQYDGLAGKVRLEIPGREIEPGVWVGEQVALDSGVTVKGPVLIGNHSHIGSGATLEPFTVVGDGCFIQPGASVKRSILWERVFVGRNAALRGAVLCSRVQVQADAGVYEGAVVGDGSVIKEGGTIKPEVKVWPHKLVESGATVSESLIWGTRLSKSVFGAQGISGLVNVEITPEFAGRVAAAYGSTLNGGRVAVSCDAFPPSAMLKQAVVAGLQSTGARVSILGRGILPMHRFGVRALECAGGMHVQLSTRKPDVVTLVFTNSNGANISRAQERKIENLLAREDFVRTKPGRICDPEYAPAMPEAYLQSLLREADRQALRNAGFSLLLAYDEASLSAYVPPLARELGLTVENVNGIQDTARARSWSEYQEILPLLAAAVTKQKAGGGAVLDANGEYLILIDDRGRVIQDDLLTALIALYVFKTRGGPVIVPVTAPRVIDALADRYRSRVVRTKTAPQEYVQEVLRRDITQFFLHFDALSALVRILNLVAERGTTLSRLVDEIPDFYLTKREIPVSWQAKGRVIRKLIEEEDKGELELLDGVKVFHREGWALVLPDPEKPVCRVYSEAASMEVAEELTNMYVDKINQILAAPE
ncbi:mannose-1-phosphate guanyltransferase [Candidatus Desulforudis audaxviator]|uniref:Nucleotidyl transferase n=1 Tax=Desulforudis audaxviator (strain MP104C) TaxID=477974 RepID=B1I3K9_DESAP|nr:mannose-1-phosphate guanyltransferase [Candidatus Desulforudis audaxviator]ACA59552.1 Nucleotidyl transferase [Candidatus Desulforudis audaxviator MP104C]AZK59535.1 Mannose-1-phosphate guanylyltransferase [Candidatus Desulforudis audaxviator]